LTHEVARKYFGTDVDFYIDGGELAGKPSTLLEFDGEEVHILRD
jgi:tRNA A37 threonylcarbamoyladenosine synthetase subunit TsaC/SUA5/YrdC